MARFSLNFTAGHWRLGISDPGSQFLFTQKLCKRPKKTFVDTVPACIAFNSSSPGVSMRMRGSKGASAGSRATVRQRCWLAPCLVLVRLASAGLPGARDNAVVGAGQIRLGDLEIEHGLALGLILRLNDLPGFVAVGGLQAGALAGGFVHAIEHAAAET